MNRTMEILRDSGCAIVEVDVPGLAELLASLEPIVAFEAVDDLRHYLANRAIDVTLEELVAGISGADVSAAYQRFLDIGTDRTAYLKALNADRPRLATLFADVFGNNGVDALIFPSTPITAPFIGEDAVVLNGTTQPTISVLARNTAPASAAGLPSLVVPAGLTGAGLPLGVELLGPSGGDTQLLALETAIARALPVALAPELAAK